MPKILIIEDDLAFGLMIQKWLMRKGFDTEKATSRRAARQLLAHASFDIILSDLRLPDGDGVTVYGRYQDWYVVSHGEHLGYVSAPFIRLS